MSSRVRGHFFCLPLTLSTKYIIVCWRKLTIVLVKLNAVICFILFLATQFDLSPNNRNMGVPEAVLEKVGSLPDLDSMSKDDITGLCKQLYERACGVFGEKFDSEYQVKKKDMEIHNLEMETSESHGTFKIPKLKKVNKFKVVEEESK